MADKNGEQTGRDSATGQFVDGNPGGPGRPRKEQTLAYLQEQYLRQEVSVPVVNARGKPTGEFRTTTNRQLFIESQTRRAINGDSQAAKNLWDRQDGKVKEEIEVNGGFDLRMVYDPAFDGPNENEQDDEN